MVSSRLTLDVEQASFNTFILPGIYIYIYIRSESSTVSRLLVIIYFFFVFLFSLRLLYGSFGHLSLLPVDDEGYVYK